MSNRLGSQTIAFSKQPRILSRYTLVGPMEGKGPYGLDFSEILADPMLNQQTPEKSERLMLELAIEKALGQNNTMAKDIQFLVAGDLLNQITTSAFSARSYPIPFLGVYGACSTFCQALGLGSLLIQGDFATQVLVATASHYQTAERQFRYPIELNIQHLQTNQHTVTGAAAAIIGLNGTGPAITHATFGTIVDWGLKDPNDMGSAMAPAAYKTITQHLTDTNRSLEDYDLVLTGDLAKQGQKMLRILLAKDNHQGLERLQDAGAQIYGEGQKTGAGGSGTACIAVMTLAYLANLFQSQKVKRALVVATGALLSPVSVLQGESIPCIAHAIAMEGGE